MTDPNSSAPGIENHPDLQDETLVLGVHIYQAEEPDTPRIIWPGVEEFIHISGCRGTDAEDTAADVQISGTTLGAAYAILQAAAKALKGYILEDDPDAEIFDLDAPDMNVNVVTVDHPEVEL